MTVAHRKSVRALYHARTFTLLPTVCTWPPGCTRPALEGWAYCTNHHAATVRRGEELRELRAGGGKRP
jgi:hypothetical protein